MTPRVTPLYRRLCLVYASSVSLARPVATHRQGESRSLGRLPGPEVGEGGEGTGKRGRRGRRGKCSSLMRERGTASAQHSLTCQQSAFILVVEDPSRCDGQQTDPRDATLQQQVPYSHLHEPALLSFPVSCVCSACQRSSWRRDRDTDTCNPIAAARPPQTPRGRMLSYSNAD